jgi:hypothetical protein
MLETATGIHLFKSYKLDILGQFLAFPLLSVMQCFT